MDYCAFILEVFGTYGVVTVEPVYFTVLILDRKLLVLYLVLVMVVATSVDAVVL
jgi:hypothetical protein